MEQPKRAVGDRVYVCSHFGYTAGRIVKVTPGGAIDVLIGSAEKPTRFRSNGRKQGADIWDRDLLDDMPFLERAEWIAATKRAQIAVQKITQVRTDQHIRAEWGKESLLKIVTELQAKLDEARAATEAI